MKTPSKKLFLPIGLLLLSLVLAETTARAVVDFKEITAVSAAIKEIYLEGQNGFSLPPGTDGQLAAETYPADLKTQMRWEIIDRSGDLVVDLDSASGLLVVAETSGIGWLTVQSAAEGCAPKAKRIEIDCGCNGEGGTCDAAAGAGRVHNGSVDVRLSLSIADQGRSAGQLILHAEEPLAILSTPEALVVDRAAGAVERFYRDDRLVQIIAPQVIVSFLRLSPNSNEIHFYDIAFRGQPTEDGLYSLDPAAGRRIHWSSRKSAVGKQGKDRPRNTPLSGHARLTS